MIAILLDLYAIVRNWHRRARTRRDLRDLDARGLADVGLTESAQRREAARWFWQQ